MSKVCSAVTLKSHNCKLPCLDGKYCKRHTKLYKLEKPDDCPVCYETLATTVRPLKCGHWACKGCMNKYQRALTPSQDLCCPVCRAVLKKGEDVVLKVIVTEDGNVYIDGNADINEEEIERMSNRMIQWLVNNYIH